MKTISVISLIMLSALTGVAQESILSVVPTLDLQRYMGTWYEIARLPNWFQKRCDRDVSAAYTLLDNGDIRVVNRCRKADGQMNEAVGRARLAAKNGPNTKLKVRFAPAFLSILPAVWGDYWIIDLAADYSYAVVGEPSRKYLWILSRTAVLDEVTLHDIHERIRQQGYDPNLLVSTTQTAR